MRWCSGPTSSIGNTRNGSLWALLALRANRARRSACAATSTDSQARRELRTRPPAVQAGGRVRFAAGKERSCVSRPHVLRSFDIGPAMPALARLAGKRVRSSECLLNNETVSIKQTGRHSGEDRSKAPGRCGRNRFRSGWWSSSMCRYDKPPTACRTVLFSSSGAGVIDLDFVQRSDRWIFSGARYSEVTRRS